MKLFSASYDPNYPNRKQSLLLAFLYFTSFALFFFLTSFPQIVGMQLTGAYIAFILSVASPICTIPLIIYASRKSGIPGYWIVKSPGIRLILLLSLLAISVGIIIQPLINPVEYLSTLIGGSVRQLDFSRPEFNFYWVINSIFTVVIVPIFEEIFFRKQILGLLLKKYSPAVAIVLGSVLFACAHLRINDIGALFIWGLLFSFVYYKTKSLEASILFHSFTNLSSRFSKYEYIEITGMHFLKFIMVMVICAIIIYLIISYLKRYGEGKKDLGAIESDAS